MIQESKQTKCESRAKKTTVFMKEISSIEHYIDKNKEFVPVLKDISLIMKESESWGIYGRSLFEIKLLLKIMANIGPYRDGKCVLAEKGMMRKKRVVLDHVFYIGTSTMPYDNMNVLEFLMFATAQQKGSSVYRQDEIFELLIDLGLGYISLSTIKKLNESEKSVITLIAAYYSDSIIIVFNLPEFEFDTVLTDALGKISKLIVNAGKTLIIGTQNCPLIEKACTHTAYVRDGIVIYQGEVKHLRRDYDNLLLVVEDENVLEIKNNLQVYLPEQNFSIIDNRLLVYENSANSSNPFIIYKKIVETGLAPQKVKINPKTVKNAYREIDRQYALRKRLFK